MTLSKSTFKLSLWHIIVVFLLLAAISWYWFSQQIDSIDFQIENLYK